MNILTTYTSNLTLSVYFSQFQWFQSKNWPDNNNSACLVSQYLVQQPFLVYGRCLKLIVAFLGFVQCFWCHHSIEIDRSASNHNLKCLHSFYLAKSPNVLTFSVRKWRKTFEVSHGLNLTEIVSTQKISLSLQRDLQKLFHIWKSNKNLMPKDLK